jgi:hypothetical protein
MTLPQIPSRVLEHLAWWCALSSLVASQKNSFADLKEKSRLGDGFWLSERTCRLRPVAFPRQGRELISFVFIEFFSTGRAERSRGRDTPDEIKRTLV